MASLILIPGLLCNQALWAIQIAGLVMNADIVVADLSKQQTISEMASVVLESAPAHFSLAGFSLGSQVALEIMSTSKERVERLGLLSATHGGLLPPVAEAVRGAIQTIEQGGFDGYLEAVYPTYVSASRAEDPLLKRCFLEMAHAVGPEAGLRQMRALLAIRGPFPNLGQIQCPTTVIGGRDDHRTTPAAHAALAQEIPGSELVIVDDAAHFTLLEKADIVTGVLQRWLTRQSDPTPRGNPSKPVAPSSDLP